MSTLRMQNNSIAAASNGVHPKLVLRDSTELLGRLMLVTLFLLSGIGKITAYDTYAGYMSSVGVPGSLLPLVIALEVLGSLAIILGWQTRLVAFILSGFSLVTAMLFHNNFADQIQMIMFLKNISIGGGFLLLVANGAGSLSLDARNERQANINRVGL